MTLVWEIAAKLRAPAGGEPVYFFNLRTVYPALVFSVACPLPFAPQQSNENVSDVVNRPDAVAEQPKPEPAPTCRNAGGAGGVACPEPFWPQQRTSQATVSPQVWLLPPAMERSVGSPSIETGAKRSKVVPSPSCPESFAPQQRPRPCRVTAQV